MLLETSYGPAVVSNDYSYAPSHPGAYRHLCGDPGFRFAPPGATIRAPYRRRVMNGDRAGASAQLAFLVLIDNVIAGPSRYRQHRQGRVLAGA